MWLSQLASLFILCLVFRRSLQDRMFDFDGIEDAFNAMNTRLTRMEEKDAKKETKWSHLIIPTSSTTKMNWLDSWSRCGGLGAIPFVPKTRQDYEMMKSVRVTIGNNIWLPSSDLAEEGLVKWWNGEVATGGPGVVWRNGEELIYNSEDYDCVLWGTESATTNGAHMAGCDRKEYPMICYKED
ncbi:unnamed protein product [Meganyctiphanes norvegica]|uniref:C-type lectin domain-containing protein n=1 Tax=Meganyctiphanes norvegica TaxID=48144 RepID=A0AAV2SRQ5_MEGNR